jgi:hypothetical protein
MGYAGQQDELRARDVACEMLSMFAIDLSVQSVAVGCVLSRM